MEKLVFYSNAVVFYGNAVENSGVVMWGKSILCKTAAGEAL